MIRTRTFDPELPFLAYPLAVDFANTTGPPGGAADEDPANGDLLGDTAGMHRWLDVEEHALSDMAMPAGPEGTDLGGLRAFRSTITELLRAAARGALPSTTATTTLNTASAAAPIHPELVVGDIPTARAASHAADWQTELVGRIARSAIELLSGPDRERLGICGAPACGLLFMASRRGQRWCSDSCGNRARVARHYHRHRRPS
jgi:predicted RNA-binding Zn ribbon-like protein